MSPDSPVNYYWLEEENERLQGLLWLVNRRFCVLTQENERLRDENRALLIQVERYQKRLGRIKELAV